MKPKTKTVKSTDKKPSTKRPVAKRPAAKLSAFAGGPAEMLGLYQTAHPLIYEVNVRVLLSELSRMTGSSVTLAGIPDSILDQWAAMGFDAVWLMGVWATGELSERIARTDEALQAEYRRVLPDVTPGDIAGSPYSVLSYTVPRSMGGEAALRTLRAKLAARGIALILDFVLPELDVTPPRTSIYNILGPKVGIAKIPAGLAARIRAIELGHAEPPVLPVDQQTMRLVLLENYERVLEDWLLYRLGSFSACPVKFLSLSTHENRTNATLITDAQRQHANALVQLLERQLPEDEDPELPPVGEEPPFDDEDEDHG